MSRSFGDMCVVAMASEDRRSFGPFAIDGVVPRMTEAVESAERERAGMRLGAEAA